MRSTSWEYFLHLSWSRPQFASRNTRAPPLNVVTCRSLACVWLLRPSHDAQGVTCGRPHSIAKECCRGGVALGPSSASSASSSLKLAIGLVRLRRDRPGAYLFHSWPLPERPAEGRQSWLDLRALIIMAFLLLVGCGVALSEAGLLCCPVVLRRSFETVRSLCGSWSSAGVEGRFSISHSFLRHDPPFEPIWVPS